jgi:hypothetical protein
MPIERTATESCGSRQRVKTLTIYLLSHNRPLMVTAAIDSILGQTSNDFRLVVSDNSTDASVRGRLGRYQAQVILQLRNNVENVFDHWKTCVDECDTTYIMLFHDDDQMLPALIKTFWSVENKYDQFAAIGFNAFILRGESMSIPAFLPLREVEGPITISELMNRYFFKFSRGIVPFPGYIYRTELLKELLNQSHFSKLTGKYSDVRLIKELTRFGGVYWFGKPLFLYRIHESNDGLNESLRDRLSFLAYLKSQLNNEISNNSLCDYRFFLYQKVFGKKPLLAQHTPNKIKKFLRYYRYRRLLRVDYYYSWLKKLYAKNLDAIR